MQMETSKAGRLGRLHVLFWWLSGGNIPSIVIHRKQG